MDKRMTKAGKGRAGLLVAALAVWTALPARAGCPKEVPTLDRMLAMGAEVQAVEAMSYAPPARAAALLYEIGRLEKAWGPDCMESTNAHLAEARRRTSAKLAESLEKDSFVLVGNLRSFEAKLDELAPAVEKARAAGWPAGSKNTLAAAYAGYYDGQRLQLMRMYIDLARAALQAERSDGTRPWVEQSTCEAAPLIVRMVRRTARLEAALGLESAAAEPRGPKPVIIDRIDPVRGRLEAERAFR